MDNNTPNYKDLEGNEIQITEEHENDMAMENAFDLGWEYFCEHSDNINAALVDLKQNPTKCYHYESSNRLADQTIKDGYLDNCSKNAKENEFVERLTEWLEYPLALEEKRYDASWLSQTYGDGLSHTIMEHFWNGEDLPEEYTQIFKTDGEDDPSEWPAVTVPLHFIRDFLCRRQRCIRYQPKK